MHTVTLENEPQLTIPIRHLYVSPGHNYFGHHGKPAGEHEMIEASRVECVAGRGVRGDRFFDYKDNYKGQITFFAWETYLRICDKFGASGRSVAMSRRNVITRDTDLNALIGREFCIQGVRFRGTEECHPCYWMDRAFAPGAYEFLKGQGGLRARILSDGFLCVDAL